MFMCFSDVTDSQQSRQAPRAETMERTRLRRKHGNTHISLAAIKMYLLHGTYPSGSTPCDKRSVRKRAESFKIEDGELYYITRPKRIEGEPVDPNPGANRANLRQAILTQKAQLALTNSVHVHSGGNHMGTERTLSALSSRYYWVGMANTVKKVVRNCIICLSSRPVAAAIPSVPSHSAATSHGSDPETAVPVLQDFVSEKKDLLSEPQPTERKEEGPGDVQYVVTAELAEPEEVDADLDFIKVMQNVNSSAMDPVFSSRSDFDSAKRFWQKVEVLILGPFPYKKKSYYVIAAMDSFSKWPEVHAVHKVNEKTVSQICLKLMARYGVMEQLILLQNEVSAHEPVDPGGICQNLQICSVAVSSESVSILDENWGLLVASIQRFVKVYKDSWFDCLDICLLPLRNTVTQVTDYTPSFLLMGREPVFPELLLHERASPYAEVALRQGQIDQSIDSAVALFLQCSIPDIKQLVLPENIMDNVYENSSSKSLVRKSGRKTKKYHRLAGFDDGDDDYSDDEDVDAKNLESTPDDLVPKKKRKLSAVNVELKNDEEALSITSKEVKDEGKLDPDYLNKSKEQEKVDEVLEKVDLDTYYRIVCQYLKEGTYPANSSPIFRQTVHKVCENFVLEDSRLIYKVKGKMKKVLTTVTERIAMMKESHIVDDGHMPRAKTLEIVESKNVFWKAMSLDIQAFVAACPRCKQGETQKRSRGPKRALRWYRGTDDDLDSSDETNSDIGKVSYEELVDYIKKDIVPDGLTRSELLVFRKRAKNFLLKKGVLFFSPANRQDAKPRKVLRTDKERQDALKEAHGAEHMDLESMKNSLKKNFFWQGMVDDAERFLSSCCQPKLPADCNADEDVRCRNSLLDMRIKVFQDYFAGMNICPKEETLDSLFSQKETVSNPLKDLVAAAMESAKLITSSMFADATPIQEAHHSTDVSTSVSPMVGEVISSSDQDSTELMQGETRANSVNRQQDRMKDILGVTVKKDMNNYEDEDIEDDGDDDDDETQLMGGMDNEDRDETWKPSAGGDIKPKVLQEGQQEYAEKKSNIRRRCEVCQEVIRGDNNFKEHMYKHTKVKPFNCNICGKKYTSIKGLKMHSRKHTGHRPYLCSICGRGFPRSASLRYHMKTHDRGIEVPVVCDVCNRTFTTENRMQKHKRFKHPAQAPVYMCEQCGKVFTAKRSLKRHEEAHQGIRKYECQYCHRSFFRKEYLNYHLVSHSNEDPSLANYKMKSRFRKIGMGKKRDPGTTGLSIVCLNPSEIPVNQDQEVYSQLVEVTDPHEWTEGERTMVYEINGDQRAEDGTIQHVAEDGTTYVVMEGQPSTQDSLEVRHIILPGDQLTQHHKQMKQITIHPQQHRDMGRAQSFEVTLPTGTHTFTFPNSGQLHAADADHDTVHYQVECIPGDTLTEDDFKAIQVLAQASLSGSHFVQQ